jgi:Holliday junction resolvase RusA-like endonuclease
MNKIKIILLGEPMPKQSVRAYYCKRRRKVIFHQDPKRSARKKDYQKQAILQLPKDFDMFTKKVYVEQFEVMYKANKTIQKSKKKMKFLEEGGIIEKITQPDLMDNLKKLPYDSLQGLVFKNDGLICREYDCSKVYGLENKITIILSGE